jgi:NitT/TauT family transport system ATP-binding protein
MQQRVAIARTLATDPDILLMDEPFGALDEQTRMYMGEELLRIWGETQKTVVFITHSLQESVLLSDRVVVLSDRPGRIRSIVDIELDRPRDTDTIGTEAFNQAQAKIWDLIKEEGDSVDSTVDTPEH